MASRFQKRIKIMPGVRLNIGKTGVSTTVGARGASVNLGKDGAHLNAGLPGTGLSSRQRIGGKPERDAPMPPPAAPGGGAVLWAVLAVVVFGLALVIF